MSAQPVWDAVVEGHNARLSMWPPKEDGSKKPETEWAEVDGIEKITWKHRQRERAGLEELESKWYANGRTGTGAVTGAISDNLECLEFDDAPLYEQFLDIARASGLSEVVERVAAGWSDRTPGGGTHLYYRCSEISGNTKLAKRPKRPEEMENANADDKVKTLIETRGEGGYIVLAPSNGQVHPSGKPYTRLHGGPATITTITPEEREALFEISRSFDEMPKEEAFQARYTSKADGALRPGDDFNQRASWEDSGLFDKGWVRVHEHGGVTSLRRPGKRQGISATLNYKGSDLFYCFSTSTEFDSERGYSKFAVYTILNHGGDFNAAALALAQQGYGDRAAPKSKRDASADVPDAQDGTEADEETGKVERVPYRTTPRGLVWDQSADVTKRLTNFNARIVSQVLEDDGTETALALEIEAALNGRTRRFFMPASSFPGMSWPLEHLGASAIVYPGQSTKEHARTAIQVLSGEPPERSVFKHTGFRQLDSGEWVFLHAGGAVGCDIHSGTEINVQLPDRLKEFVLPDPPTGQAITEAVAASLRLYELGPETITVPLLAAIYRAPLGSVNFSIHISGRTGTFKTEVAALVQQHYGAGLNAANLPAFWSSTDNALEMLASYAKDMVLVIDDFVPGTTARDAQKMHAKADRVLRAQGNNSGRQRLRPDGTLRPTRTTRSLIISTGEDVPPGQSLRARMKVIEVGKDDISPEKLGACQKEAAAGLYSAAMSAYLADLAPRYEHEREALHGHILSYRESAASVGSHRRTPEITASLAVGWSFFLDFALRVGAITQEKRAQLWADGWQALIESASQQDYYQGGSEPVVRFLELTKSALGAGKAHIARLDGGIPEKPEAWGWRAADIGTGEYRRTEWQPQGERIGWLDIATPALFLDPDAAYKVARSMGGDSGEGLTLTPTTLWKRLLEQGVLQTIDNQRHTLKIRRVIAGQTRSVLHLDSGSYMSEKVAISDISDI